MHVLDRHRSVYADSHVREISRRRLSPFRLLDDLPGSEVGRDPDRVGIDASRVDHDVDMRTNGVSEQRDLGREIGLGLDLGRRVGRALRACLRSLEIQAARTTRAALTTTTPARTPQISSRPRGGTASRSDDPPRPPQIRPDQELRQDVAGIARRDEDRVDVELSGTSRAGLLAALRCCARRSATSFLRRRTDADAARTADREAGRRSRSRPESSAPRSDPGSRPAPHPTDARSRRATSRSMATG